MRYKIASRDSYSIPVRYFLFARKLFTLNTYGYWCKWPALRPDLEMIWLSWRPDDATAPKTSKLRCPVDAWSVLWPRRPLNWISKKWDVKAGAVLALARWGTNGGPQFQPGAQYAAELRILLYFAAELRILLVYLSECLGRLGQNGGPLGAHFSLGAAAPLTPRRTAPA